MARRDGRVFPQRRETQGKSRPEVVLPGRAVDGRQVSPRNILFLMTDQHRVDTLGAYGNPLARTPVLDELARTGTRFDRWYTPTAICTPARASLLTGQAPFRHKLLANQERNVGYSEDLPEGTWTFPQALRSHGYNCGLVGKWHAGTVKTPADYGLDGVHLPGWHNPVDHPDYLQYLDERGLPPYEISDRIRGTLPNGQPGNLLAARLHQPVEATFEHYLATRTIEMLRGYSEQDRPFFLALHFFGPHLPYIVPPEYFDLIDPETVELPRSIAETFHGKPPVQRNYSKHWTFDTMPIEVTRKLIAVYWGYVTLIDEQLGRVLAALRELGRADDTSVFFTCDHGEFTGAHRLHDKGPAMYEDIYRTPGLIRVPGAPQGQVRQEFVSLTDCTATILDLAGIPTDPISANAPAAGISVDAPAAAISANAQAAAVSVDVPVAGVSVDAPASAISADASAAAISTNASAAAISTNASAAAILTNAQAAGISADASAISTNAQAAAISADASAAAISANTPVAVDSRSLLPLIRGESPEWSPDIVAEFHGHHFPYPQRMLRTDRYKLVVNPDSINELYDLTRDPDELLNIYELPETIAIRSTMLRRLYTLLRDRGDNFHHWMASMYDVGSLNHDPTLSGLDESTYASNA
ncbi:sulfatase-like hydrolase/transferase [Dactylosporangium sp. NPDC051541]|uniref:sulfatase-like hydrolase/transferase n=1 Tax=Dactylosporangium sp. NPDC051541 TaxID=3363977 RepID=UPI0037ACEBF1